MSQILPQHGEYIHSVRESARETRQWANITISDASIHRFLTSPALTTTFARLRTAHGYTMPLKFPSILAELNLLAVLSLLNFGSGYRVPLHAATGRGAFDNIRALVFGLHISSVTGTGEGNYLSANGMRGITEHTIADMMGVTNAMHTEKAHKKIPEITVGELGGPVYELVQLITKTLNETGAVLLDAGYPDLGSFVLEAFKESGKAPADKQCDAILEQLARGIPAFRDMEIVDGHAVYCFKKALLTIHAVALRWGHSDPQPFPIPSTTNLPIFVDNVIPSLLVHLGVIDLSTATPSLGLASIFPDAGSPAALLAASSEELSADAKKTRSQAVPKAGPRLTKEQAYVLRAAAIDACELVVRAARTLGADASDEVRGMTPPELDAWLWAAAKDRADYRSLERFVLTKTTFF